MKRLISTMLLMLATTTQAETPLPRDLQRNMVCIATAELMRTVQNYGEQPSMIGQSIRLTGIGDEVFSTAMVLFINYQTRTWTLAERIDADTYCVLAVGQDIEPMSRRLNSPAVN